MVDKKEQKADITSVARAAKVSASTVSRYFNHPELVKSATRRKIDSAVRKQGYIRNRAAQTIHGIRSGTIGVLVPTIDHAIFAEVVQAFSDQVGAHGFTILLASHGYNSKQEYAVLRKFLEHRVDGVVLTGLDHDEAIFQLIESQGIPSLLIWNHSDTARLPSIGADNFLAGEMIAQHILDLGHKEIACMFPPVSGNDRAQGRKAGVLAALKRAAVEVPKEWHLETIYSIASSKRDTHALLAKPRRPTAVICGNDILATGALYGARACGLDVPSEVSIVGIGDFKGSSEIEPALSTVRLPAVRIGREAADALARAITHPGTDIAHLHCHPELVVRASSGRV